MLLSAGAVTALAVPGRKAVLLGAVVPWCGVLAWLLFDEYFLPDQGGGASMWPIAQVVGGTAAALVGAGSSLAVRLARSRA